MAFAAPQGPLSGVLATVDVTTDDGLDASSLFARRVAELGGVVSGRLSGRVTHAVFRGPPEALRSLHDRLRRVGAGGAAVVGVSWLAACLGARARAAEAPHALPRPPDTLASLLATPRAGGGSAAKRRAVQPPAAFVPVDADDPAFCSAQKLADAEGRMAAKRTRLGAHGGCSGVGGVGDAGGGSGGGGGGPAATPARAPQPPAGAGGGEVTPRPAWGAHHWAQQQPHGGGSAGEGTVERALRDAACARAHARADADGAGDEGGDSGGEAEPIGRGSPAPAAAPGGVAGVADCGGGAASPRPAHCPSPAAAAAAAAAAPAVAPDAPAPAGGAPPARALRVP